MSENKQKTALADNLYSNIEKALLSPSLLKDLGLTIESMEKTLDHFDWKSISKTFVNCRDCLCADVLELSIETLERFSQIPEEGFLKYIFDYTHQTLFPDTAEKSTLSRDADYYKGRIIFSEILKEVLSFKRETGALDSKTEIFFLKQEEIEDCQAKSEYDTLKKYFDENYVLNFLAIGAEITPFDTKGHIAGVHSVAMHVGRQLKESGVPVDLACISGAAISHDIGKFGCKTEEHSRIPYLHYYYTDDFLTRIKCPQISLIASNHSTWDLEIENLSVESLLLIYADFRTKSSRGLSGKEIVHFYSLEEAFDVILSKLDNVDEAKKGRYIRVYKKLYDFEKYMKACGVSVSFSSNKLKQVNWKDPALLTNNEAVDRIKYWAIKHNIEVMSKIGGEISFGNLLEHARSDKDWKNLRAYVNALAEYYTYMSQIQKETTINFLIDLLAHREGDIRRQAAVLIGKIIATYDAKYRKELPKGVEIKTGRKTSLELWSKYLQKVLFPDLKTTEEQRRWIGYTIKITLSSLLEATQRVNGIAPSLYVDKFKKVTRSKDLDNTVLFIVLDTILEVPFQLCSETRQLSILNFALKNATSSNLEVKVSSLRVLKVYLENMDLDLVPKTTIGKIKSISKFVEADNLPIAIIFLKYRIQKSIGVITDNTEALYQKLYYNGSTTNTIHRENLKVATPWVIKAVNIKLLLREMRNGDRTSIFYLAMHFSNLLKTSERITVRHLAGEGLLEVSKFLNFDQRNEIVVELTKGLEIGDYQFSKYIPKYLGALILDLRPEEFDETLAELRNMLNSSNERVVPVTLDTLGEILSKYDSYKGVDLTIDDYLKRKKRLLGMILKGMANYKREISKEAFMVLGQHVFASEELSINAKFDIFKKMHKKMISLVVGIEEDELTFFNNAATLNHIYRFASDYEYLHNGMNIPDNKDMAFFPGTFDPFSLSHKAIATAIRDMGYEVYMAIDEFSWSKKTQPRAIRKQIVNMSIADEMGIYVYPDDQPINIANDKDIEKLKKLNKDKNLFIVVGSDVIENASSYKAAPREHSIHSLNHLVFKRESDEALSTIDSGYAKASALIKGEVVELSLPTHLEDISSTRIRDNIDSNRDIATLIDPVTQRYIYDNSLYMREPQYKTLLSSKGLFFQPLSDKNEKGIRTTAIGDVESGKILARATVREAHTGYLYDEFKSEDLAAYVRKNALGKIIIIQDITINKKVSDLDLYQLMLTETLSDALREDFAYAVYKDEAKTPDKHLLSSLERQGFIEILIDNKETRTYAVDMRKPTVLFQNTDTILKDPFNKNKRMLKTLHRCHKRLQLSLAQMYPGSLILSINSSVMNQRLIEKITGENGVPSVQLKERKLGPYMCVPFGNILRGMVVPNTVTKTLHTEKYFDPQMESSEIAEYPFYATIENQVETLKSFNRPAILVDDILHKGYRIKTLDGTIRASGIDVKKIVVGLLSGRGQDLMRAQDHPVESVYFLPNLESWFVESSLYPFLGGDGIKREGGLTDGTVTSINLILPYVMPRFLSAFDKSVVYNLSETCLLNTKEILETLEEEYQIEFQRKLTLQRLSEAVKSPKYPDVGACLDYDKSLSPSAYINSDIEKLIRLKGLVY